MERPPLPSDDETLEVTDQEGRPLTITRGVYADSVMERAEAAAGDLEAQRQFAIQLLREGFPDRAEICAARAVALSDGAIPDQMWRAATLVQSGRLEDAEDAFEEVIEDAAYPKDIAQAMAGLGRTRTMLGRVSDGEKLMEQALDECPDAIGPMMELIQYRQGQDRLPEAIARIEALAKRLPRASAPPRALAHAAFGRGDAPAVLMHVRDAVQKCSAAELDEVLAEATMLLGQSGQAAALVSLVEPRRQEVRNPTVLFNLAQALVETGRAADARTLYDALRNGAPPHILKFIEERVAAIPAG